MKQLYQLVALSLIFFSCANKSPKNVYNRCDYTVWVTSIVDGDTFKGLTADNDEIKFRIFAIDAPEKSQAFGNKSKQYLAGLIFQQRVGIKIQKKNDAWGRPVVWVYTAQGQDIGAEMLKAGMAWHFKKYDSSAEYANLETQARRQKLGLWQDNNPIAPWDFRSKRR